MILLLVWIELTKNKNREVNRLDLEKIDFHNKIREGYLQLANKFPNRIIIIDASKSLEVLSDEVFNIILTKLNGI